MKGTIEIKHHTEVIIDNKYLITAEYDKEERESFRIDAIKAEQEPYYTDTLFDAIEWCLSNPS